MKDIRELQNDIDLSLNLFLLPKEELLDIAKTVGIKINSKSSKEEIIKSILEYESKVTGFEKVEGTLEILDNYGFLRKDFYVPSPEDVYVGISLIKKYNLRTGDYIIGWARPPKENEKYRNLQRILKISDLNPDDIQKRQSFEKLVPVFPHQKLNLEIPNDISLRIIDLFTPIGKGQRALIVAPPRAGKTTLLKKIAQAVNKNHPEVYVIALLVDERPEEVTDMSRSIKAEIVKSTFDEIPEKHLKVTELAVEKAKSMVELGKDVLIIMDSLTRLTRACNLVLPPTGRTLSGGLDTSAIYRPKKFFGAARKIENGGSLTIIATVLVETGSKMDEVIFEEFKGTGNMELHLSRILSEKRIFPAIDINKSGTRHEELLLESNTLQVIWTLRRLISKLEPEEATQKIIEYIKKTKNNQEFIELMRKQLSV
ncbi:MAG: transcription termination factor Rho [Candidatus Calescibacterium sp.]|nr:transcription termination factor Rho [Candidatus Calescibacterium sp.]MCX7972018.1 transcription termination factor Rho [bacterium]MDW8194698.1 transcription termination factor Rho [Candidatus Calescibacterium sp.]